VEAIGFDICRTYLDIAVHRMGAARPHLVVADVENLPIRSGCADAVLAYESFHHLPNRPAAMRSYDRALKPHGRVVLAEPGAAHEDAQVSVDVMKKYGILEKGMELDDVIGYAAGTALGATEQNYVVRARGTELHRTLDLPFIRANAIVTTNLFTLVKGGAQGAGTAPAARRRVWPRVKRRIKAALLRIGLD
jgi:SAM-dependent methyltransferase